MANRKSIAPQGYNIFRDTLSALKKTVRKIQEHPYSDNDYLYIEAMGIINFMLENLLTTFGDDLLFEISVMMRRIDSLQNTVKLLRKSESLVSDNELKAISSALNHTVDCIHVLYDASAAYFLEDDDNEN